VTSASIVSRVQALVARIAGASRTPASAGPDTPLGEGGYWLDSVDLLEVAVACEREFGLPFDAESDLTAESLTTVRSLAEMIRRKGIR
jgi:acyl carrier protein